MIYLENTTNIIVAGAAVLACISELFPRLGLSFWLPPPPINVSKSTLATYDKQVYNYFSPWISIARFFVSITIWLPLRTRIFVISGNNMIIHLATRYALAMSFISRFSQANQEQLKWLMLGYVAAFAIICYVLDSPWPLLTIIGGILISYSGRKVSDTTEKFTDLNTNSNSATTEDKDKDKDADKEASTTKDEDIEAIKAKEIEAKKLDIDAILKRRNINYNPLLDYIGRFMVCVGFLYMTHRLLIRRNTGKPLSFYIDKAYKSTINWRSK